MESLTIRPHPYKGVALFFEMGFEKAKRLDHNLSPPELLFKNVVKSSKYRYGEARLIKLTSVNGIATSTYVIILKANGNWFLLYEGGEETEDTFHSLDAGLSMLLNIDIEITVDLLNVFLQPEPEEGLVEKMMIEVSKVWYLNLKSVGCDEPDSIEHEGFVIIPEVNTKHVENEFWKKAFCDPFENADPFPSAEQAESIAVKLLKLEDVSSAGTPISILMEAVEQESKSFMLQLLLLGINPNHFQSSDGNTALHVAAKNNNKVMVKLLLAFKADPSIKNKKEATPTDLAADEEISCLLKEAANMQAKTREYFASNPSLPTERTRTGTYLMSLDGGGICGFNTIAYLIALEDRMKELLPDCLPIHNYFDYIAGTSSGAIAALTLLYTNHSLRIGRCLVYQISKVFTLKCIDERKKSIKTNLQSIFKGKVMSSLKGPPHAIVTATEHPRKLCLITNYDESEAGSNQQVWEAAHMSSAAPFFFPAVNDIYFDGGLVANNPTRAALEEISKIEQNCEFGCVLSIGTGSFKDPKLKDKFKYLCWNFPFEQISKPLTLFKNIMILIQNRVEQSSEESAKPLCEAKGWEYHRWSPPLHRNLGSACTELDVIIDMMYHTEMHILQHPEEIDSIAKCILARKTS